MYQGSLTVDSWIREAQEAQKLVEDVEAKVKNKSPEEDQRLVDRGARSKLLEVGIMLDRLESLLHNPPSNLVITEADLEYRWNMLSDIKMRTKELAQCLYALSSPKTPGGSRSPQTQESSGAANIKIEDRAKLQSAEGITELLNPLIADEATENEGEMKQGSSFTLKRLLLNIFWAGSAVLGAAGLLFVLVILTSMM